MALDAAAVERYTQGRLDRDDTETVRQLTAALAAVRRWCRWHVTPVQTAQEFILDGRGGRTLVLPTMCLVELVAISEDGVELDVDGLDVSPRGMVEKQSGAWWTRRLAGIGVTMTHGYSVAPDFEAAVLSVVDRASLAPVGGRPTVIGPFQYGTESAASGSTFTDAERALLEQYRLESLA